MASFALGCGSESNQTEGTSSPDAGGEVENDGGSEAGIDGGIEGTLGGTGHPGFKDEGGITFSDFGEMTLGQHPTYAYVQGLFGRWGQNAPNAAELEYIAKGDCTLIRASGQFMTADAFSAGTLSISVSGQPALSMDPEARTYDWVEQREVFGPGDTITFSFSGGDLSPFEASFEAPSAGQPELTVPEPCVQGQVCVITWPAQAGADGDLAFGFWSASETFEAYVDCAAPLSGGRLEIPEEVVQTLAGLEASIGVRKRLVVEVAQHTVQLKVQLSAEEPQLVTFE